MLLQDLFEKKNAATAWVIVYTADQVILGKRAPTINNPNQWNFFGGHIDDGESSQDAAARELHEETGYTISPGSLKHIATIGDASYFSARVTDPGNIRTSSEISKVRGFKLRELPDNLHAKTENFFDRLDTLLA